MKYIRLRNFIAILALPFAVLVMADLRADETKAVQLAQTEADEKLHRILGELASADFKVRVAASAQLQTLSAKELTRAVQLVAKQSSAEAILRLLAEIDDRYVSKDEDDVAAASMALEALAQEGRQIIADGAQHSLAHHWLQRVELAQKELASYGAIVKKGAFAPGRGMFRAPRLPSAQILIGDRWHGGDEGIDVFKRLKNLVGAIGLTGGVVVYLLDGHPLTAEQEASLAELVGAGRIAKRSAVALGIGPDRNPFGDGRHVLVRTAAKGGSAQGAGIEPGDLITAIENPNKEKLEGPELKAAEEAEILRDFDDLVERLRAYKRGDVIKLRVIPKYRERVMLSPRGIEEKVIDVKLKGWEDLESN